MRRFITFDGDGPWGWTMGTGLMGHFLKGEYTRKWTANPVPAGANTELVLYKKR